MRSMKIHLLLDSLLFLLFTSCVPASFSLNKYPSSSPALSHVHTTQVSTWQTSQCCQWLGAIALFSHCWDVLTTLLAYSFASYLAQELLWQQCDSNLLACLGCTKWRGIVLAHIYGCSKSNASYLFSWKDNRYEEHSNNIWWNKLSATKNYFLTQSPPQAMYFHQ